MRSFYTRLLAANSTPAMIERTAALLAPIFANGRREIRKRVREAKDPALVLSDIPVVVHSTAGLRDMDVTLRQDLFRAINFVINGSLESDSLFEEMMIATNKAEALCPRPRILTPLRTRFKVNVTRDAFLETKVMRFFTNPRYCRAITGKCTVTPRTLWSNFFFSFFFSRHRGSGVHVHNGQYRNRCDSKYAYGRVPEAPAGRDLGSGWRVDAGCISGRKPNSQRPFGDA